MPIIGPVLFVSDLPLLFLRFLRESGIQCGLRVSSFQLKKKSKKQHAVGGVCVCICLTVSWVNWAWISVFQSSSYFCFVKSKKEFEKNNNNNLFLHSVHFKKIKPKNLFSFHGLQTITTTTYFLFLD